MRLKPMLMLVVMLAVFSMFPAAAGAADPVQWRAVATSRPTPQFEVWPWLAGELTKRTNGAIKVEVLSLPELGLTGLEMMRVTRAGLVDIADISPTYVSGDLPALEAVDLPGVFPSFDASAKAHRGFVAAAKQYEEKLGAVILGAYLWPETVIFSRKPIRSPADFKGLKIRVFGGALTDLAKALGAEPVSVPFAEVYTALERGTIDASFTGTYAGYSLKWYEVTKFLVAVNLGPSSGLFGVSKKTWDRLDPATRATLVKLGEEFTERGIDIGLRSSQEGVAKNREKGMEWIPLSPPVEAAVRGAVTQSVVPSWLKRAGPDGRAVFDKYIAPYAGFKAP